MRPILLGVAILLTGISGLAAAQDTQPVVHYLSAYVSGNANTPTSYHYFDVRQTIDPVTGKRKTMLELGFNAPEDDLHFRWAALENCNIDNNSITVTQSRAYFDAVVPDLTVCGSKAMERCTWTSTEHEQYSCEAWTGPVSVELTGEMTNAVSQATWTEVRTEYFKPEAFSLREQCQSGSGWGVDTGGFSFLLGEYSAYIPFEYEGGPGTAQGSYEHRTCRTMTGTKK